MFVQELQSKRQESKLENLTPAQQAKLEVSV